MSMQAKLNDEVVKRLDELATMESGTEEYDDKVNSLVKLMDRSLEFEKIEVDVIEKSKRREDEKKDQLVRNVMNGTKDAAIIILTVWGTVAAINFEKEGTITTSAGRKHLNKLLSWFK